MNESPEAQERIATMIAQAREQRQSDAATPPPVQPQPTMMDQILFIRNENAQLMQLLQAQQQQIAAQSQVIDAVGQAVGYLYQSAIEADQRAEQPQPESESYSERFAQTQDTEDF